MLLATGGCFQLHTTTCHSTTRPLSVELMILCKFFNIYTLRWSKSVAVGQN